MKPALWLPLGGPPTHRSRGQGRSTPQGSQAQRGGQADKTLLGADGLVGRDGPGNDTACRVVERAGDKCKAGVRGTLFRRGELEGVKEPTPPLQRQNPGSNTSGDVTEVHAHKRAL